MRWLRRSILFYCVLFYSILFYQATDSDSDVSFIKMVDWLIDKVRMDGKVTLEACDESKLRKTRKGLPVSISAFWI